MRYVLHLLVQPGWCFWISFLGLLSVDGLVDHGEDLQGLLCCCASSLAGFVSPASTKTCWGVHRFTCTLCCADLWSIKKSFFVEVVLLPPRRWSRRRAPVLGSGEDDNRETFQGSECNFYFLQGFRCKGLDVILSMNQ